MLSLMFEKNIIGYKIDQWEICDYLGVNNYNKYSPSKLLNSKIQSLSGKSKLISISICVRLTQLEY